eukprot:GDKJ01038417.1.p1 GENE.GDKJ01038417.1~~GDKJ01038417.1.p1  ORF type:complete len:542 (+),score=62.42 GDKJ01038417.1:118-1743(+)
MKNILLNSFLLLLSLCFTYPIQAHIGSSGVVFEGNAGKYALQVYVQPPDVIPGTAKVTVIADANDIQKVNIKPIYYWFGDEGSPRSDEAFPVANQAGRYEGQIWLMNSGAASVQVEIIGSRGKGSLIVPLVAIATAKRAMSPSLGWVLAGLGLLLVGLLTTIIGASTSDSLQTVGEPISGTTMKKRIRGSVIGASFCGVLLFVGNNWWNGLTDDYQRNLYKPYTANTKVIEENGVSVLKLQIDSNSVQRRWLSYAIPDHGKLMHLFLIRQGTMDVFAHLHPSRKDTLNFEAQLPDLPAGKYLLYADVMRYQGAQYTIADTVEINKQISNGSNSSTLKDPYDAYAITNPLNTKEASIKSDLITICGTPGVKTKLQDGSSIVWEEDPNKPLMMGKVYDLKFSILSPDGTKAKLEPYLGMMGHAAIVKDDGSVYIHLHPTGTVSSTSVSVMQKRLDETSKKPNILPTTAFKDSVDKIMTKLSMMTEAERDNFLMPNMLHTNDKAEHHNTVNFPYVFPQAGKYRIWLQVKRNGKILTGTFDAKVM